ncbi:MAG: hypothetical protein AAF828_05405 [Bacteroidota bacterium]
MTNPSYAARIIAGEKRQVVGFAFFRWRRRRRAAAVAWLQQLPTSLELESTTGSPLLFSFGLSYFGMKYLGLERDYAHLLSEEPLLSRRAKYDNGNDRDYAQFIQRAYGFVMLGGANRAEVEVGLEAIRQRATGGLLRRWQIQFGEQRERMINGVACPIGPLGFREGISQPRRTEVADTCFVDDPKVPGQASVMSFMKLRINTEAYQQLLGYLALAAFDTSAPNPQQLKKIRSLLMGRSLDGVPLALDEQGQPLVDVRNDFTFNQDREGKTCPFASHVRVMNPRAAVQPNPPNILRRSIPYREGDQNGLLFISFQHNFTALTELYDRIVAEKDFLLYSAPETAQVRNRVHQTPLYVKDGNTLKRIDIPLNRLNLVSLLGEVYFYVPPTSFCRAIQYDTTTRNATLDA